LNLDLKAPAKINWFLKVDERREDGFHLLRTVFQSISFADDIRLSLGKTVEEGNAGIRCTCRPVTRHDGLKEIEAGTLNGQHNLAYQAAELFGRALEKKDIARPSMSIDIKKRIPLQAGLAGGSSDAAAVLRGFNSMMGFPLNRNELAELACQCGSDVLFCLDGGTQWGGGTGRELAPLAAAPPWPLVIVRPAGGVSTKEAYKVFDDMTERNKDPKKNHEPLWGQDDWQRAFAEGDKNGVTKMMSNSLEPAAIALCPEIAVIKEELMKAGCLAALMSGSGSAVFGLVRDEVTQGYIARHMFKKGHKSVWAARTDASPRN